MTTQPATPDQSNPVGKTPEMARVLSNLRHLFQNLHHGVKDSAQAKRIAEGMLSPAIADLERMHDQPSHPTRNMDSTAAVQAQAGAPVAASGYALGPLPTPDHSERIYGGEGNETVHSYFSATQMREYARQAVYQAEHRWSQKAPSHEDQDDLDAWHCDACCGKGWNWESHQVAERKSDQQEFKTDCPACDGTGWVGPDAEKAAAQAEAGAERYPPSDAEAVDPAYELDAIVAEFNHGLQFDKTSRDTLARVSAALRARGAVPTNQQLCEMAYLLQITPRGEQVPFQFLQVLRRQFVAALTVAALAAPMSAQGAVPSGWKLVPVEPTDDMIRAGQDAENNEGILHLRPAWRYMIAAAPAAPMSAQPSENPVAWKLLRKNHLTGEWVGDSLERWGDGMPPNELVQSVEAHPDFYMLRYAYLGPTPAPGSGVEQDAARRGAWPQTRAAIAMVMAGWGNRPEGERTLESANEVLDAVSEPGMPLAILRSAPDWRAAMAAAKGQEG